MKKLPLFLIITVMILAAGFILQSFTHFAFSSGKVIGLNEVLRFKKLSVEGPFTIFVTQGDASVAKLEGDEETINNIEFVQKKDELNIRLKDKTWKKSQPVNIYLSSPDIDDISLAGSGSVLSENSIQNDETLSLSLAGSGEMKMNITTFKLDATIAGSGNITLAGNAKSSDINVAGSGDLKADELITAHANVSIAGSGNVLINVMEDIYADIAGSGDLIYSGNAKVNSTIAGSGEVIKK